MKILILANNDVGLYQFRRKLIEAMLQGGHQVLISLPDGPLVAPLVEMGCTFLDTPIDRRGLDPVKDLRLLSHYRSILKEHRPDLVVTYTIKPNIYGGIACRMKKTPYAINITGLGTAFQKKGLLRSFVVRMYRAALKEARVVFFENSANRNLFLREKIVSKEKCRLLSGAGVDLSIFTPAPYPQSGPTRFLFVGRVMKEKGVDELFSAMEQLHARGEDCVLDVLGGYEEDYAPVIERFESQGWLHYHGYQTDVRPFIEKAHCFVLPSYHEGMANTNLECAAMARPVITTDIPGCREAVTHGSGILCKPKNTDSLFSALDLFLHLPTEARISMGLTGRQHMEAVFDKEKVVSNTLEGLNI